MFSIVSYARMVARVFANTLTQGDIDHFPFVTTWPSLLSSRYLTNSSSPVGKSPNTPAWTSIQLLILFL